VELYEKRCEADYDPMIRVTRLDAIVAIGAARRALAHFTNASSLQRAAFLHLLLFPPRR
jgi:hypothetical protein